MTDIQSQLEQLKTEDYRQDQTRIYKVCPKF